MAPLQRSKSASQADQLQIQHFIHQHLLHKLFMTSEFNCDGCNTGGHGVRYRCSACDFDLHEQCAVAPHRISANLHPNHHLILVNRPGDSHFCHVCKGVTNGLCYTCEIHACEFNVHTVCVQIPVAGKTGDKSLTLGTGQGQVTVPTMSSLGGYNGVGNNNIQPVLINQQQQMQGTPITVLGGFDGVNNSQPVMVNHHQPQLQPQPQPIQGGHAMQFGGYNGANASQPMMVNNNQTHMINQQQQLVKPMAGYGGYNGVNNNSQHMMVNNNQQLQQKQGMPTTPFGGYQVMNNNNNISNQTQMINQHQQQQQRIPTAGFGGYNGGVMNANGQPVMVNHQQQVMPTTSFNTNQQYMTNANHQQVVQQQQQGIPHTAVGGYSVVNNNQTVMIHHPPPPPPPPPPQQQANGYTKVGKIAANIISTSLIGIPLFNSRN